MLSAREKARRTRSSRGQVLLVSVMVLLILVVVVIFLFDLQGVIRLRAKSQTAADAAALTAAAWQGRTLNVVGELNLVKAATVILNGLPGLPPAPGTDPAMQLLAPVQQLTNMQTRLLYTGPLLGFAAAQQAAKHNGLRTAESFTGSLLHHVHTYLDASGGSLYLNTYGDDPEGLGFAWTGPYGDMLHAIAAEGVAANPVNSRFLCGIPELNGPGADLLLDPGFYRAVHAQHFCWFYRRGLGPDHPPIDLDAIQYQRNAAPYFPGSEYLPLYVRFSKGPPDYAVLGAFLDERNMLALSPLQPGLAEITWAVYEPSGDGYGWDSTDLYTTMNDYLRSDFRKEYTYGGACARMTTTAKPSLLAGRWSWKYGQPADQEKNRSLGNEMAWSNARLQNGKSYASEGRRLQAAEERLARLRADNAVVSVASAKAFGHLHGEAPQTSGVVLPVFTEVRLIPVGVTANNPLSSDAEFYQFIVDYFGSPDYPNVPPDIVQQYSYYISAIQDYNNPGSGFSIAWVPYDQWRIEFMAGPDGLPGTSDDKADPCKPVWTGGGGGGGGSRGGPGIIH